MSDALMRSMMMREAIASCGIEGASVSPEREAALIRHAAAGQYPCPHYEETWCARALECNSPCDFKEDE